MNKKIDFDIETMGKRINQRRNALGLSQMELAEKINISNNHLSNIERGKENLSISTFIRICTGLNITPDFLILGSMRSNNVSQDISDSLRLCNERDLKLIKTLVDEMIRCKIEIFSD